MKPKNATERRKAFFNFLLLFVLSTAVVVVLAFSSTQVPLKHNALLQKQVEASDREAEFSRNFMSQMTGIMSMLDTINIKTTTDPDMIDGKISTSITKLSVMIDIDSVRNRDLYKNIVTNLSDLQRAKKQLRKNTEDNTDISQYKRENEALNDQLEQCKNKRDDLQRQVLQLLKN